MRKERKQVRIVIIASNLNGADIIEVQTAYEGQIEIKQLRFEQTTFAEKTPGRFSVIF
jgi:hypothetical protein